MTTNLTRAELDNIAASEKALQKDQSPNRVAFRKRRAEVAAAEGGEKKSNEK